MTSRAHHRNLTDQLGGWTVEQVAELLRRRPDLVQPRPPADIAELAQRAQYRSSVEAAIAATTLTENRLLQLVVCCRPDVAMEELARALPEGVDLDDLDRPLTTLEEAALVWRHQGRLHSSATLRQSMVTTLGPPLAVLLDTQTVDYVRSVLKAVHVAVDAHGDSASLPPRASGPDGRPPRKAELVEELASLLALPAVVDAVLAGAPQACGDMARALAEGPPVVRAGGALYFSSYSMGRYDREQPAYWLFERALLFPVGDGYHGVQPREVGVALRAGRPVADLALDPPELGAAPVEPSAVDASGAARVTETLDRVTDLLDRWEEAPAKTLKTGGLGATVMKQTAAALETDAEEASRLVELANLAGLIETTTVTRKEKRVYVYESFVGPTPAASAWRQRELTRQWRQLATAWLRAERWPSATGRKSQDTKLVPVLGIQYTATATQLRRRVLDVLGSLAPGTATTPAALAAYVYWERPQPWLGPGVVSPSTAIGWIYAEAELLGVVAGGALTTFGRALVAGHPSEAEQALEVAMPEPATTFTLQADLTATVVGSLERSLAVELRLLADVESTGAATTLRFSDASLRRAIDAGRDADAILTFLEAHATKGVPKALAYLVGDVARRHGHLQVGSAASFVTSEDPAVLADACSHRRTRKLALRLLAPTVAVSRQDVAKVMDGLRDAGFLPAGDGEDDPGGDDDDKAPSVSIGARAVSLPASGDQGGGGSVPEPFRASTTARQGDVPAVDAATAALLAKSILAGPTPGSARPASPPPLGTAPLPLGYPDIDPDTDADDDAPVTVAALLEWAYVNDRALAISLGDEDDLAEPMLVAVTIWEPDRVIATDLTDGTLVSILPEHVGRATDLGPVEEIANVALLGSSRRRSGRRPQRG
ncbi:helicase-associated domain-containing protein [soil metagenome]